jgi:hypothetical protein
MSILLLEQRPDSHERGVCVPGPPIRSWKEAGAGNDWHRILGLARRGRPAVPLIGKNQRRTEAQVFTGGGVTLATYALNQAESASVTSPEAHNRERDASASSDRRAP